MSNSTGRYPIDPKDNKGWGKANRTTEWTR